MLGHSCRRERLSDIPIEPAGFPLGEVADDDRQRWHGHEHPQSPAHEPRMPREGPSRGARAPLQRRPTKRAIWKEASRMLKSEVAAAVGFCSANQRRLARLMSTSGDGTCVRPSLPIVTNVIGWPVATGTSSPARSIKRSSVSKRSQIRCRARVSVAKCLPMPTKSRLSALTFGTRSIHSECSPTTPSVKRSSYRVRPT